MALETVMSNMIICKGSGPREENDTTTNVMVVWLAPLKMPWIIFLSQANVEQLEQAVLAAIRAHILLTLILCGQ